MSKRNVQVIALAGAAALAGFGYTLARRSGSRAARSPAASPSSARRGELRPRPAEPTTGPDSVRWQDAERISSSPDALDLALDLDGVFDGKAEGESEITARPNEHLPTLYTADDEDAPSPDDLGRVWLTKATESEHSLSAADTVPELENLRQSQISADLGEGDGTEDDETTAEYVRRHRISSAG